LNFQVLINEVKKIGHVYVCVCVCVYEEGLSYRVTLGELLLIFTLYFFLNLMDKSELHINHLD